jgi:hypothetical protein
LPRAAATKRRSRPWPSTSPDLSPPIALVDFSSHLPVACSYKANLLTTESATAKNARREDIANGTCKRTCEEQANWERNAKRRIQSTGATKQQNKWNVESQEALLKMVEDMPNATWGERATWWESAYPLFPNQFTDKVGSLARMLNIKSCSMKAKAKKALP